MWSHCWEAGAGVSCGCGYPAPFVCVASWATSALGSDRRGSLPRKQFLRIERDLSPRTVPRESLPPKRPLPTTPRWLLCSPLSLQAAGQPHRILSSRSTCRIRAVATFPQPGQRHRVCRHSSRYVDILTPGRVGQALAQRSHR